MLTENDFLEASKLIGCDVPEIKAVYKVEANGSGLLSDGRVKVLFEGHRFWKQLKNAGYKPEQIIVENPKYSNVLYPNWDRKQYKGGAAEWDRISSAIELCKLVSAPPELAIKSASYGSFQIMGENCTMCGYVTAQEMIADYNIRGEKAQLESFIKFIKSKGIAKYLISHEWDKFALGYNGSAYKQNQYDTKLQTAYNNFKK